MKNIALILIGVFMNAGAQLFMRQGMLLTGEITTPLSFFTKLPAMLSNIWLWVSIFCYAASAVVWMIVLSKVEAGFAYAFISLGFVLVSVFGFLVFHEHLTTFRVIGIALICAGLIFVGLGT
jgi:multidrug transporter EmrE-like cation transporter